MQSVLFEKAARQLDKQGAGEPARGDCYLLMPGDSSTAAEQPVPAKATAVLLLQRIRFDDQESGAKLEVPSWLNGSTAGRGIASAPFESGFVLAKTAR